MFERYTEKARRIIFFARYEASQYGSPYIEITHLLFGLLREDYGTIRAVSKVEPAGLRQALEPFCLKREKIATSVDLPVSHPCRRALAYAAEEAERMGHTHIGQEHVLLGRAAGERCGSFGTWRVRYYIRRREGGLPHRQGKCEGGPLSSQARTRRAGSADTRRAARCRGPASRRSQFRVLRGERHFRGRGLLIQLR